MTSKQSIDVNAMATQITAGVEHGDINKIDPLIDPECQFWHNFDPTLKSWAQVRQGLQGLSEHVRSMQFENVRVTAMQGGWVQQHLLRMVLKDGSEKQVHAAMIYKVNEKGLVSSMEEYLDPAHLAGH